MKVYLLFFITLIGCKVNNNEINSRKNYLATANDITISTEETDSVIKQQIYDELYRIYLMRKEAIELIIEKKLLLKESEQRNISIDSLIKETMLKKSSKTDTLEFINQNNFQKGIPKLTNTFSFVPLKSEEGENLLKKRYSESIKMLLIDSLKNKFNYKLLLLPPKPPFISLSYLVSHKKGNPNAKVTVMIASDVECEMCKKHKPFMDSIFNIYRNKICVTYTPFSYYVSLSSLALESASEQGKYWEMANYLYLKNPSPNENEIKEYAYQLKMDTSIFAKSLKSILLKNKMEQNYELLRNSGLYAAPTVIIDNIVVQNSFSAKEICNLIESELKKN